MSNEFEVGSEHYVIVDVSDRKDYALNKVEIEQDLGNDWYKVRHLADGLTQKIPIRYFVGRCIEGAPNKTTSKEAYKYIE